MNSVNLGGVSQSVLGISQNNESELGRIANNQLLTHFGYNAAFGLVQETLGKINLNPLTLVSDTSKVFVQNFSITVPKGSLGGPIDFISKVTGTESPVSLLADSSSIFQKENPVTNTDRLNQQVLNTGKGQVVALIANLDENKYRPLINDDRKKISVTKGDDGTNGSLYTFEGAEPGSILNLLESSTDFSRVPNQTTDNASEVINALDTAAAASVFEKNNGKITSELSNENPASVGFDDLGGKGDFISNENEIGYTPYSWNDNNNNSEGLDNVGGVDKFTNPKSLLYKTQNLFKTNKMMTLVSGHGVKGQTNTEIQNINTTRGLVSKGSAVLSSEALNSDGGDLDPETVFCRTWTTYDRYNKVSDLQKNSGLFQEAGQTIRKNTDKSVLDDNGFVRIAPKISDKGETNAVDETTMKRFMFSLENLAWSESTDLLPPCERGPGDPITGTKGRIMWFPPYDMNFSDTASVNWDTTNFIGRGEPIYTYNNTERMGNLSFKIIIDHATYMNEFRNDSVTEGISGTHDDLFTSIVAGCSDLPSSVKNKMTNDEKNTI